MSAMNVSADTYIPLMLPFKEVETMGSLPLHGIQQGNKIKKIDLLSYILP